MDDENLYYCCGCPAPGGMGECCFVNGNEMGVEPHTGCEGPLW